MGEHPEPKILIGIIAVIVIILVIVPIIATGISSGGSYSGGSNSGSSYKSKDPADYDSKGNYKPVETMTQEEKKQELIDILEDSLY